MPFAVFLHKKAALAFKRLDPPTQKRLKKEIAQLAGMPEKGKHLEHSPFWSLRVGDYHAIYEIDREGSTVTVLFVGHRKKVYDDFSKLI